MQCEEENKTLPEDMLTSSSVSAQVMDKSGGQVPKQLPSDMVEKILAMVPFPSVYKARCLAKSWKARFAAISSQHDEAVKFLAIGFQKQVSEWSHKWETFCPVVITQKDSIAFHWATQSWIGMPSLSFLPERALTLHRQMKGPLLLAWASSGRIMYVANVLTEEWKTLPLCPLNPLPNGSVCSNSAFCVKLLVNSSLQTYQVIRFCRPCVLPNCHFQCTDSLFGSDRVRVCSVQLYDSQSDAWTSRELDLPGQFGCVPYEVATSVYFDGIIYMVASRERENILCYSVEKERFQMLSMPPVRTDDAWCCYYIVDRMVFDDTLLIIVAYWYPVPTRVVLKIDLKSQEMLEVARGPAAGVLNGHAPFTQPVADGNCIFFAINDVGTSSTMLTYDLAEDEWGLLEKGPTALSYLDVICSSFQPGFMPFIEYSGD